MYLYSNKMWISIVQALIIFIPITEIVTKIIQNILGKIIKPSLIPKMDFSLNGIGKDNTTMVVIPTIIENR